MDVKAWQCHGTSGTWGDIKYLFKGSHQDTDTYIVVHPQPSPAIVWPGAMWISVIAPAQGTGHTSPWWACGGYTTGTWKPTVVFIGQSPSSCKEYPDSIRDRQRSKEDRYWEEPIWKWYLQECAMKYTHRDSRRAMHDLIMVDVQLAGTSGNKASLGPLRAYISQP
jgi:hypothetical protein